MRGPEIEDLTVQFYAWELRGRGWFLWPQPVDLEPPFRPFYGCNVMPKPIKDDGRRHTLISGAINLARWCTHPSRWSRPAVPQIDEPLPDECPEVGQIVELQVALPPDLNVAPDAAEQFLCGLGAVSGPLSFEIVGLPKRVAVQIACDLSDADIVQRQIAAYFPEVTVVRGSGLLDDAWRDGEANAVVAEFGLKREFVLPLAPPGSFKIDPLMGIIAALADADVGEVAALQILFQPVRYPWAESIVRSVMLSADLPLFEDPRDFAALAQQKVSRPLYAVVVRVASRSPGDDRAVELARGVAGAFAALASPSANELFPLDNEGYADAQEHEEDFLNRRSRRGGMLLSSDELVALVHLPSSAVREPKLRQAMRRSKAAPNLVLGRGTLLGTNEHAGEQRTVVLKPEQRARHVHVLGASGTGKSTLLLNLISQDLASGDGLAVLDPHGDLIDAVIDRIPPERAGDVVLIDPADEEFPVGFNVLSAHSALEKNLLASDLVAVFRRLATSWGDQMNSVLGNAILAFLESDRGGTLADLRRFLVEPAFRKDMLRSVQDQEVVYYWTKEFPLLTGRPQGPVLTRLDTFLRPKPIRHMVAQRNSRLDFADILDSGKILLARLSHGAIGAENAYLLGTLLVSKLHQLALGRQRMREEERRFFWLYIDECHHFATPSMASILSGIRKYRLGLVLAHQELQQLDGVPEFAAALVSNAYTRVCFRLGDDDAKKLGSGFKGFESSDLQNLGTGEAIVRVERAELDFNLRVARPPAVDAKSAGSIRDEIIRQSRERYATPRSEVEAALNRARGEADPTISTSSTPQTASQTAALEPAPRMDETGARQSRRKQSALSESGSTPMNPPPPATAPPAVQNQRAKEENGQPASANEPAVPVGDVSIPVEPPPTTEPPTHPPASGAASAQPVAPPEKKRQPSAGRGGAKHQQLQKLIKQWAEAVGYRASIEGQVLGCRAADVALEKEDRSIACELCVTTTFVHELGNIRKCLDAGFTYVAAISPEPRRLAKLREVVQQQLDDAELERVKFVSPDELLAFLQELEGSNPVDANTMHGYKVKMTYKAVAEGDAATRQQQVAAVIDQAMRRLKGMQK